MPAARSRDKRKRATANGFYIIGRNKFRIRKDDLIPANADEVLYEEREEPVRVEQVISNQFTRRAAAEDESFDAIQNNEGALAPPPSDGQNAPAELAAQAEEADDAGDVLVESPAPAQEANASLAVYDDDVPHVEPEDLEANDAQAEEAPEEASVEDSADESADDNQSEEQAADVEKPKSRSRKAK